MSYIPDDPNMPAEFVEHGGVDYIKIQVDKNCNITKRVEPQHIERWPRTWAAYKEGKVEVEVDGTPLTEIPGVDDDVAINWKLRGIRTVEELAALHEGNARAFGMGGITQWQMAKIILEKKQQEALLELTTEPRRGPGRPRKEETEQRDSAQ